MQSAVVSWYLLPDRNPSIDRRSMFSGGNLGSRSGKELLPLVDAPCFLKMIVLLGAWALIMEGFDSIYYTIPGLLRVHSLVGESVTEYIINYPIGKVPMEFCPLVWVFPSMC